MGSPFQSEITTETPKNTPWRDKMSSNSSSRVLLMEFNKLTKEPVEGFEISLKNEDIYNWVVVIFGPPKTLYEGGYFKAEMTFPTDYPYSPPQFRFMTEMWHPNIYENGDVCISILPSTTRNRASCPASGGTRRKTCALFYCP